MGERDDQGTGEVLSSLPSRRPQRRSARRDGAARKAAAPGPGGAGPAPAVRQAKARSASAPRQAKAKGASRGRRPAGVRPSAATRAAGPAPDRRLAEPPEGIELVGTAIQAAGELAQLSLTLGTKALRRAVARIPRP